MLIEFLHTINWVDIVIMVSLLILFFLGVKKGFIGGIFWLLGIYLASVLALHYYPQAAESLGSLIGISSPMFEILSIALIVVAVLLTFWILRAALKTIIKAESVKPVDTIFGIVTSACSALLLVSLLLVFFYSSNVSYLEQAVLDSRLSKTFIQPAPKAYLFTWKNVLSKFMTKSEVNNGVNAFIEL